jgi:membrane protease subunit HflK
VVDSKQGSNLMYLPLDKIMQMSLSGSNTSVVNGPAVDSNASASSAAGSVQPTILPPVPADARSRDSSRSRERDVR